MSSKPLLMASLLAMTIFNKNLGFNTKIRQKKSKKKVCPICKIEHDSHTIFCSKEHFLEAKLRQKIINISYKKNV